MASRSTRGARGTVSGPGAGQDFVVTSNIREVLADLRQFDRKLATATRRRLRQSGDDAIEDMRGILAEPSPGIVTGVITKRGRDARGRRRRLVVGVETEEASGRARSRGARDATAAALRTRVVAGQSRQTIRITGAGDAFSRSYNLLRWRHPIRFNPETTTASEVPWVEQGGRPYFGTVIGKRFPQIRREVDEALGEALDAIAQHSGTTRAPGPV